jgi:hypothetical protein
MRIDGGCISIEQRASDPFGWTPWLTIVGRESRPGRQQLSQDRQRSQDHHVASLKHVQLLRFDIYIAPLCFA